MPEVITSDNKSVEQLHSEVVALIKSGQEKVDQQLREIEERGKASAALGEEIAMVKERVASLQEQIELVRADVNRPIMGDGGGGKDQGVFDRALEEPNFKAFLERGYHKGSVVANLKGLFPSPGMTTITSSAVGSSTPGILVPARVRDFVPNAERRLTIRDLLPSSPVGNNAVEYVQENAFTNAASPQVEGSDKAESALTFTIATANVRTIAHWIPATAQVLDDWAQLRRIIENKMLFGLKYKEEAEILSGAGTGQHLNGLITQATAYQDTNNATGDTRVDTLLNALTELQVADESGTNFAVIHPNDFNLILKVKDQASGIGNYVVGGPVSVGLNVRTLWGVPLVVTPSMTSGSFLVGNSGMAEVFDRMQATVAISTEHSDYFTKNMVAIRVEERIALAVYRTSAFITGSF